MLNAILVVNTSSFYQTLIGLHRLVLQVKGRCLPPLSMLGQHVGNKLGKIKSVTATLIDAMFIVV